MSESESREEVACKDCHRDSQKPLMAGYDLCGVGLNELLGLSPFVRFEVGMKRV